LLENFVVLHSILSVTFNDEDAGSKQ